MGVMTIVGASLVTLLVPVQTLVQEVTPERLRGRVFGLLSLGVTLASILPMLLAASITDILGVNVILTTIGLVIIGLGWYSQREFYEAYAYRRVRGSH
jgi:MFS family permease